MASEATYRTVLGIVKFPPKDATVKTSDGDVEVRNILLRNVGVRDNAIDVRATLWPSHAAVAVEEGDLLVLEGKFTVNKGENSDGEPTTYFNLSVNGITKLGSVDKGVRNDGGSSSSSSAAADEEEAW